jgi:integrase
MRGEGRVFRRKDTAVYWCAYYQRGKEIRESTGESNERKALKYLQKRQREVANDHEGIRPFVGPQSERIKVSCGIADGEQRKPECDCLCCALERDYRLRGKASAQNLSNIKRVRQDFGQQLAMSVTAQDVERYIERRVEEGAAPATINRSTQLLGQGFKLAIRQRRLTSAPFIRRLSEIGNVRQGFYSTAEFEAIVGNLPEYLQDFARWGFRTGMRKRQIGALLWEHQDHDGRVIHSTAPNVKNRKAHSIELDDDLRELIERRRAARQVKRDDGTLVLAAHIFHRDGEVVGNFRRSWQTACVLAGLGRFLCRHCEGVQLNADRKCPECGHKWNDKLQPKYVGRLFHDCRRSAVRAMVRAGVPESVAMSISGHRTRATFDRYDITDGTDQRQALQAVRAYRERQAAAQREKLTTLPTPSKGVN